MALAITGIVYVEGCEESDDSLEEWKSVRKRGLTMRTGGRMNHRELYISKANRSCCNTPRGHKPQHGSGVLSKSRSLSNLGDRDSCPAKSRLFWDSSGISSWSALKAQGLELKPMARYQPTRQCVIQIPRYSTLVGEFLVDLKMITVSFQFSQLIELLDVYHDLDRMHQYSTSPDPTVIDTPHYQRWSCRGRVNHRTQNLSFVASSSFARPAQHDTPGTW